MLTFKAKIACFIAVVLLIPVLAYFATREDPIITMMGMLDEQTDKCISEIHENKRAGDECAFMLTVGEKIFQDSPSKWGKVMIADGHINNSNIDVVVKSIEHYTDAILLIYTGSLKDPRISS